MPGTMIRDKQLSTPPPEKLSSKYTAPGTESRAKHNKGASSASAKRFLSGSSHGSNGQFKRTAFGSEPSNVIIHDDLLIRLLAQRALVDASENHVLSQEEIDDLRNVSCDISRLTVGT